MKKRLIALAAATSIGIAGMAVSVRPADAGWWVAPAIVGGVLLGGLIVASAANAGPYGYYSNAAYAPRGNVYVRPGAGYRCRYVAVPDTYNYWRPVRVCQRY